ncbi:hypothetical protein FACS1894105_12680 [Clostridia bacterium]|nr:hypothetical protein FACS1894105_12680 [Clostridia bacterium]
MLGVMGTTGDSTGIHLHFGLKRDSTAYNNGEYVDPLQFLLDGAIIATPIAPAPSPAPVVAIKAGDKVRVTNAVTVAGKAFTAWHSVYDVIQVRADGAVVIGVGKVVTAAVDVRCIERI